MSPTSASFRSPGQLPFIPRLLFTSAVLPTVAALHQCCSAHSCCSSPVQLQQTSPAGQQDYIKGIGGSAKVSSLTIHNCFFIYSPRLLFFAFCISCIFISPSIFILSPSPCRQLQFMLVPRFPTCAPPTKTNYRLRCPTGFKK